MQKMTSWRSFERRWGSLLGEQLIAQCNSFLYLLWCVSTLIPDNGQQTKDHDHLIVNFQVGATPTDGTPGFVKCEKPDCEMCQFVQPQLAIKSTVTGYITINHYQSGQVINQIHLLM